MIIKAFSPTIRRKEMDAVLTALVEDSLGPGEYATRFLQVAKEYIGYDYSIPFRSPVFALYYALKALDLPRGSGVVISVLSPFYYLQVLRDLELEPVLVDVEETTGNISGATIQKAIQQKKATLSAETKESFTVRACVLHHTLGYVPEMQPILDLGLPFIEDCSKSFGTNIDEQRVGSFGVFTLLGLEERDLFTAGGGCLLYAMNRREGTVLRRWSTLPPEYRLPDVNAAMATVQFKESERNYEKRRTIAEVYTQAALQSRHKRFINPDAAEYNNYCFPLVLQNGAKDVIAYGVKKEIEIALAFQDTIVAHLETPQDYPVAYSLSLRTVLFPFYPRLSSAMVQKVARLLATLP